jgi:hypothetical protein
MEFPFSHNEPKHHTHVLEEACNIKTLYMCLSNSEICLQKPVSDNFQKYVNKHSKSVVDTNEISKIFVYYTTKSFEDKSIGRMYPIVSSNGISPEQHVARRCMTMSSQMPKILRDTICYELYHDIDFKNSNPIILNQLFTKNNIICKPLKKYINNRDKILDNICEWYNIKDKNIAKNLFLRIICGGGIHNWKLENNITETEDDEFAILFQDSIRKSVLDILKLKKYDRFTRYSRSIVANPNEYNPFSAITYILETIENRCLIELYNHYISLGYTIGSFEFDGMKISRKNDKPFPTEYLKSGQEYIKKMTEFDVELVEKIMTPHEPLLLIDTIHIIKNDTDISEIILKQSKGKILYVKNDRLFYYKSGNCWYLLKSPSELNVFVKNYTFIMITGSSKIIYNRYNKNKQNIYKDIIDTVINFTELHIDNFDILSTLTTKNKICFKNGVFDLILHEFIPWEDERTNSVYTTIISDHIYDPKCMEMIDYMYNILSEQFGKDIFPEFAELIIRALAGHVEDKRWLVLFGNRNSGKGLLCELLESCFGKYIQTANCGSFSSAKTSNDPERERGWLIPMCHSRLIKVNEVESNTVLNGGVIKSVCSGGDTLKARALYSSSIDFKIECTFMICCNDIPKIEPLDTNKSRIAIEMPLSYTDELELKNASEERRKNLRLIIPDLKDKLKSDKRCLNAFITILFKHYVSTKPNVPKLISMSNDFMDAHNDSVENILKYFVIDSTDESNILINAELTDIFDVIRINLSIKDSDQKLKKILKDNGARDFRNTKLRGLKYIKLREE